MPTHPYDRTGPAPSILDGRRPARWTRAVRRLVPFRTGPRAADVRPSTDEAADSPAWPEICDQAALRIETLTEQVRPALDALETDEADPERVQLLYELDHGVSRMRRTARELRILAGRRPDEAGGRPSSLLDVVRVAASMIEHYGRVRTETVADRAVLGHAADDLAALLAVLLDNATRYSPAPAQVGTHLFGDGSVLIRIEDGGPGMDPATLEALNRMLAAPVPPVAAATARRTGFPVAHRLARKHGLVLALVNRGAARAMPGRGGDRSGTVAMVTVPPRLLTRLDGPAPPWSGATSWDERSPRAGRPSTPDGPSEPPPKPVHGLPRRRSRRPDEPAPARPPGAPPPFADGAARFAGAPRSRPSDAPTTGRRTGPCSEHDLPEGPTE